MTNLQKLSIDQIETEAAAAQDVLLKNSDEFKDIGKTGSPTSKIFSHLRTIQRWTEALLEKNES